MFCPRSSTRSAAATSRRSASRCSRPARNYAFLANTTGANIALLRSCATVGVNVQFMANIWGMDEAGMKAAGKAVDGLVLVLGQAAVGFRRAGHEDVQRNLRHVRSDRQGLSPAALRTRRLPGAASGRGP